MPNLRKINRHLPGVEKGKRGRTPLAQGRAWPKARSSEKTGIFREGQGVWRVEGAARDKAEFSGNGVTRSNLCFN